MATSKVLRSMEAAASSATQLRRRGRQVQRLAQKNSLGRAHQADRRRALSSTAAHRMTSRTTTTRTTITTTVTTYTIPSSIDTQAALIKAEQQNPNSAASKLCRQTHWMTGGLPRNAPATAEIFYKRISERKKVCKAELEWKRRKQQALEKQEARWGSSGLMGLVDNTMPRGRALMQWHEELFKESRSNGDRAGPSG